MTEGVGLRVIATLPGVIAPMIYGEMLPAQLIKLKEAGGIEHLGRSNHSI